jgi:glycosyltransferase involved in cell wall biosynthesis
MLSVVIPALNEEDGIADMIHRVQAVEPDLRMVGVEHLEIIVVDDGSHDRTADIAARFSDVRLVRHATNRGYGAAIKTGFGCARGDLLGFLDADGTYPPEGFASLCRVALDAGADLVVGSRRSGAASQMPMARRIGNLIWANLVTLLGNHRVVDPASGMRVLRQAALQRLYPLPDGLNFTPVMSTRAVHEGLQLVEVPVSYRERVGHSKLSVVRDGIRFLTTILWTTLEYNPVRLLGLAGVLALATAAAIGVALVVLRLQGVTVLGSWGIFSLFSALVLAVAGVSLFSLGATFNYLVSLFHRERTRQGLFGRPLFRQPLERRFGWLGVLVGSLGAALSGACVALDVWGWDIAHVWFWLVVSALLVLVGIQLILYWVLMRVLEQLSERELRIAQQLAWKGTEEAR